MAEKQSKSKLKRNKSAREVQVDIGSGGKQVKRNQTSTLFSSERNVSETRSVWWSSEQLTDVETLWALTLKSGVPYLEEQLWDPVPDLPPPSTTSTRPPTDDQWRCGLTEEVPPLPEPSTPPPRTSSQDQQLPSSAEISGAGEDEGRRGGESGGVTHEVEVTDGPVSQGGDEEVEVELVEDEDEEEVQSSVAGCGGLQSCPMCLLEFPAGFTQMDCDGHLAQCLAQMNVDMTW